MEITVIVLPNGHLQIMVDGVPFDAAKAATGMVLQALSAQGTPAQQIGEVESHRDGVEHVHEMHQHVGH